MNDPRRDSSGEADYDYDEGDVFLDEDEAIHEISIDEEELPDWDDEEMDSDVDYGHRNTVSTLNFSSDGQFLATGSFDGLIQVWDANLGSIKCTLEGSGGSVEWLKWHPKGHLILAGSEDSSVWLWNADKSISLNTFYGHASSVTCGDFSPDGKLSVLVLMMPR